MFVVDITEKYVPLIGGKYFIEKKYYQEMCKWLEANCIGEWKGDKWVLSFELESDAMHFKLVWG